MVLTPPMIMVVAPPPCGWSGRLIGWYWTGVAGWGRGGASGYPQERTPTAWQKFSSRTKGRNQSMIIDVHAHYHPRAYNEALERAEVVRAGRGSMPGHPDTDDAAHLQARLEMMEQAGVGLQVLSPAAGRAPYAKDEAAAVAAARL